MTKQMMWTGAAVLAAAAGSATAQMNYDGLGAVIPLSTYLIVEEGSENYTEYYYPIYDPSQVTALSTPTTFSTTLTPDASLFPHLNSASVTGTTTAQASPTRFEVSWNFLTSASIVPGADPGVLNATSGLDVVVNGEISFDSDTRIRISFNRGGSNYNATIFSDSAALYAGQSSSWPYAPFASDSSVTGTLAVPFSFEVDMHAGDVFDFDLLVSSTAFSNQTNTNTVPAVYPYAEGWNENTSFGSFVVEVIPAPSSAALLGLGGLAAARRRRAR